MNGIASASQFDRISTRSASSIENSCARTNPAFDEPGDDRVAFLANRAINQEIEGPCVFRIERAHQRDDATKMVVTFLLVLLCAASCVWGGWGR